jgi:hypothetical protein
MSVASVVTGEVQASLMYQKLKLILYLGVIADRPEM